MKRSRRRASELETTDGLLVSVETGARQIGVSTPTMRGYITNGLISHVRLGHRVLLRPEALKKFVEEHEVSRG